MIWFRLVFLVKPRERYVARVIRKAWHSRERQALLFLIIKQKNLNNHHAVMVVIKVIGH